MSNKTKNKMSLKRKGNLHPLYGKHHSDETKEKIKIAHIGKDYNTKEYKEILRKRFSGRNNPNYGKGHLISGKNNPFYGKHHTEKTKQKIREIRLKNGKNNYNPIACEYFNKLNEEKGWNLQHALNGGEIDCIGYSLDAYDKEKNIVVEYDEIHHNLPSIKEKDLIRQNRIINHLKCQFYRFNEKNDNLYQII
jgi:hypothetical protein